jgi:hypothetical protein
MFVRTIVVADEVNPFVVGDSLIDHAQKAKPFLMAMSLLAQAEDLPLVVLSAANKVVMPFRL